MRSKASIIIFLAIFASFNSPGQSPADLISKEDSLSLSTLIGKIVRQNHLCKQGEYSVIYCYRMEYSGENVVEDIYKNTLIKNVVFSYNRAEGFWKKKKYPQVEAFIFGPDNIPLATHCTYCSYLGVNNRKPGITKVSPGSHQAREMSWLATLQTSDDDCFIFELAINDGTPLGYYLIWTDNGMKYYKSTMDGWKEISKHEYAERILPDQLIIRK